MLPAEAFESKVLLQIKLQDQPLRRTADRGDLLSRRQSRKNGHRS